MNFAKYRPHRLECGRLQGFLAVGTKHCLSTARDHYRPLSKVPPAYRPHRNLLFSGCSMPLLTTAIDAVDTLRVLSRWFVLLGEVRLCVSFCRDNIHAPAQRLHLPLQVCRRELLATAHPEAGSVATTAPAGAPSRTSS